MELRNNFSIGKTVKIVNFLRGFMKIYNETSGVIEGFSAAQGWLIRMNLDHTLKELHDDNLEETTAFAMAMEEKNQLNKKMSHMQRMQKH